MPLTLVLGPANSAKAGAVLGAYADASRRDGTLVVPTATDARHYERELAGQQAVFGSVLTFTGLAREIAARSGYSSRGLSGRQRERVLRRAVGSCRLRALSASAGAPGFAAAAGDLIAELQRSLVTPQRFAAALTAWAAQDARRGPYAEELAGLYRAYVRELDRLQRVDAELFAWRALDSLRATPGSWGTTPVFFYGFDDLLGIERDAVETLARVAGVQVMVSLTYEPGRSALSARAGVVEELRAIAGEVRELPALDEHYESAARRALHHLERNLFEPEVQRIDPGASVRLLEAGGERAEAELVAAEVLELLRAGVPADEIVVVCRSLARSAPLLELVFERYGIAAWSDRRIPVQHTALGRSITALARCALLEPGAAAASELLTYLRAPGRLDRLEVADALEAEIRRGGLLSAEQARQRLGWRLEEIDALRAAADPAAELARQARRLLAAPHRAQAPVLDPGEELDAGALAAILTAVAELEELGERLSGPELIELLERLELPARTPPHRGAVLLSEPLGIRARRFRAVFVCGLCEGEFPLPGAGEPFLSDERRHELALASGLRLMAREDALGLERYLLYTSVSRASELVAFSYRSSDEEGNLVLPSPFIADLADLFVEEWQSNRRRRLLADVTWAPAEAPTERELQRARSASSSGARASADRADAEVRRLGERALRHVRHREVVSAGALESFGECPVKWLIERQLDPTRFEPAPDPLSRGSYMHDVLERVLSRLGGPVTPGSLDAAQTILGQVLAEQPVANEDGVPVIGPGRPDGLRAALLRSIEADLRRYLEHEALDGCDWAPAGLELRFGFATEEGSLPAVRLGDGEDRVLLRGVIDRIDVDPAGGGTAVVRDYKSGSTRPEHQSARWGVDRRLQIALYMVAVRELLELRPVAGLYQPLSGRDLRSRGVFLKGAPVGSRVVANDGRDQDQLDALLTDAQALAVELAARLRAGELQPCPSTCSRDGCRYPGICWSE
ncbi:MAG: PD-(D/E)XK nuclease family protein [Actinomycetota bacterium]|nr:PD-(D/E)XK nuclease family protein [Actinomycetota bacterium]